MRLYLSSFRLGAHPEQMVALLDRPGPVAVIANAMDAAPAAVRAAAVELELTALAGLGLAPVEVDLRRDDPESLARYPLLWVRGGNVFVLRDVLARSGAGDVIVDLLARDAVVYTGYSAGPCVIGSTLRGLEIVDDVNAVAEPTWDGLGVLDFAIVPHVDSPEHHESERCGRVAERHRAAGVPHRTLRDGQALVIDGSRIEVC